MSVFKGNLIKWETWELKEKYNKTLLSPEDLETMRKEKQLIMEEYQKIKEISNEESKTEKGSKNGRPNVQSQLKKISYKPNTMNVNQLNQKFRTSS